MEALTELPPVPLLASDIPVARDFNHMGWRGALDASVGFLRASIRRSVEVESNALLLLALNKRLARMEEVLQAAANASHTPSRP
jgi:hypothetical protein